MSETITPRNVRFGISSRPTRHWLNGDFAGTAAFDCFSVLLPQSERKIIRSVKRYENRVEDPELLAAIEGLSQQEGYHSREHNDYNRGMKALGYDVDRMEQRLVDELRRVQSDLSSLGITCAIEHFATSLAAAVLRHPQMLDNAAEPYRHLWLWHAVEELEHRTVALDVLAMATRHWPAYKRYGFRVGCMNVTAYKLMRLWVLNVRDYARADGMRPGLRLVGRMLWALLVSPGVGRRALPVMLRYYKPGYAARVEYDPAMIERWRVYVDGDDFARGTAQAAET